MPLDLDIVLGALYLSVNDFKARAKVFGVQAALPESDDDVKALLAAASRAIDAFCGRAFTPDVITETHRIDLRTRRIAVNQPPVQELTGYKIIAGPGMESEVELAAVYVNNQENYLELVSLQQSIVLTGDRTSLGMSEAQVEVKYKSFASVPQSVAVACGYAAAKFANLAYSSGNMPDGISRVKIGNSFDMTRQGGEMELPAISRQLLAPLRRIAVG
jgi:hypothetical protein